MNKRILQTGLVALALSCLAFAGGCSDVSTELETPTYKTGLKADEIKNSAFKAQFPKQTASYEQNNETTVSGCQ